MRNKLLARGREAVRSGLGVFYEYPLLLRFACISVCAEIAWATLIIVLQYHFQDDLLVGQGKQLIAARIATVTLAFVGCETLFKIPMGALTDRYGPRPMIFFALVIAALSPLLMTQATQWYHFVPLRATDGLAAAALWPAMSALMARSVPRQAKAAAMSVFNGAYCLGLAVGPVVGLVIGHKFGNTAVFPLCSLLLILGILIARTVLRPGVGDRAQAAPGAQAGVPLGVEARISDEASLARSGSLLRGRPLLVRMMLLYAVSQCAVGMFANVMVVYLKNQFNIVEGDLPRLLALPALFVAFIALPLGRMADAMGRPRAVWISSALAAVGMLLVALTSLTEPVRDMMSAPVLLFGVGLLCLVTSYILGTPAWLGLTSVQVDDTQQGQALSLMQTAQGAGMVLGSALVASAGHLLTRWHSAREVAREAISKRLSDLPGHLGQRPSLEAAERLVPQTQDVVPITVWLWIAAAIFVLCLIGTLLWVREPEHAPEIEEAAQSAKQPLEVTGI